MTPSPKSATAKRQHSRILIRSTNWIGDAVMTMPAVQRLRELYPDAHIALLCHAKLHDLWRHNAYLTETIPFDPHPQAAQLRDQQFDLALILPNSFRSAWEAFRARIPRRVGFAGNTRSFLLTDIVEEPRSEQPIYEPVTVAGKTFQVKQFATIRHQALRYLDIVSYLGGDPGIVPPKIWLAPEEMSGVHKYLPRDAKPVFALNAGAEFGPAKRWPAENFAEVARRVASEVDAHWLLLGGPGDVEIARAIQSKLTGISTINVAGKTTLLELCELLRCCRLMLTNDTGPMHIGAAVGIPVVAIFGSTSPELTGPLGPKTTVLHQTVECNPCFLRECPIDFRCMHLISVEQVTKAVLKQLAAV